MYYRIANTKQEKKLKSTGFYFPEKQLVATI